MLQTDADTGAGTPTSHHDPLAWDATAENGERIQLDMVRVTREALGLRAWHLEYECHGTPYIWRGEAANESAADSLARHDLSVKRHEFNAADATLIACLEA